MEEPRTPRSGSVLQLLFDRRQRLLGGLARLRRRDIALQSAKSTAQQIAARSIGVDEIGHRRRAFATGQQRRDRQRTVVVVARVDLFLCDERAVGGVTAADR